MVNSAKLDFRFTEFSEVRELGFLGSSALVCAKMCRLAVAPFQAGAYAVQGPLREGGGRS
jgi:hypothetical protein